MPVNGKFLAVMQSSVVIVFTLIVLSLLAVQPFTHNQLPLTDDGLLHLYRVIVLDHSLTHDSMLYPRYSSGLVYGYGASLFNYFPPVSYLLPRLLHLVGLTFTQAWLWTMVLYTLIAAGGAYLLGSAWTNRAGGLITAAAYIYSPYWLFNTVTRGTSSEVAGLMLLPLVMWAFYRLAMRGGWREMLLTVVIFALFIPMHNIVTLQGTLMLLVYCLLLVWIAPRKRRAFSQLLLAGGLAVMMTAFFWLPALGETDYTKIQGVTQNLNSVDVTESLRPLSEVLAPPRTADPTQLQAPTPISIGWIPVLLAIIGGILVWRSPYKRLRPAMVVMSGIGLFWLILNLEGSGWLWESLPLMGFSQFAWRTLGPLSLVLAWLAGVGAVLVLRQIPAKSLRMAFYGVLLASLMLYGVPWLYTLYHAPEADSVMDTQAYERQSDELALSSYSEYLPVWTEAEQLDPDRLRAAFRESPTPVRLIPPDNVTITQADWRGTSARLTLTAASPATLVFDWLYMPGWQASFEDAFSDLVLTVKPAPDGRVSLEIPAGTYQLHIRYEQTTLQTLSEGISLAGVVLLVAVLLIGWRVIWRKTPSQDSVQIMSQMSLSGVLVLTVLVSGGVFLFKTVIVDHSETPFKQERFAGGTVAGVQNVIDADFGGFITLRGVSLPETVISGEKGKIRLFWSLSGAPVARDFSSAVTVRNSAGVAISDQGSFMPGNRATSHWIPGTYLEEVIELDVPCGTPPGTYTLDVGLYDPVTLESLSVLNEAGNPVDVRVDVGTITVLQKERIILDVNTTQFLTDDFGVFGVQHPGDDFEPWVFGLPEDATAGDELAVSWEWLTTGTAQDYQARLVWLDESGDVAGMTPAMPITPGYPTSAWDAGDYWTGTHRLYVPGSLDAGVYTVGVQLLDEAGDAQGETVPVETMTVRVPNRVYDLPDVSTLAEIDWANGMVLRGYDLADSRLSLVWETTAQLDESLRLFVHVLDGERIVAQRDVIPVDWSRPTTGWQPGEVIVTEHDFSGDGLESGRYALRLGWYEPINGERVSRINGDDSLLLDAELVIP